MTLKHVCDALAAEGSRFYLRGTGVVCAVLQEERVEDVLRLCDPYHHLAPILAKLMSSVGTIGELLDVHAVLRAEQDVMARAEELLQQVDRFGHLLPKELAADVKNFIQGMEPLP